VTGGIAHWDDVDRRKNELGHISGTWRRLADAAGSVHVGVNRIEITPGKWSTPAHSQGAEEEIFYVLGGSGLSWQDDEVYEVAAGDCIVHRANREEHTLRAGADGLDVLVFGTRVPIEIGYLPRAGVAWLGYTWVEVDREPAPWPREAAVGEPEVGEPAPRPPNIVNLDEVATDDFGATRLAAAGGAEQSGLNHVVLPPGGTGPPPHCHSAEEEVFVVLSGDGVLELTPAPVAEARGAAAERHEVRAGSIVARPAATRVAHAFRAGDSGLTYLAYGTREPNDLAYYPRSRKVYFRGLGVIARVEPVDYMDGER
jgi:uncharacterized cupin superfamily protein